LIKILNIRLNVKLINIENFKIFLLKKLKVFIKVLIILVLKKVIKQIFKQVLIIEKVNNLNNHKFLITPIFNKIIINKRIF
jgi:hypothetical protein